MDKTVYCVLHFLRLLAVWWPCTQSARDNHPLLACNYAKYSPTLTLSSPADLAMNLS